jgi:F-type H+-transporting ATPase subunit b
MDVLSAFGVNWKLLVVQAVNFSLVLLILWRFLYRPLFAMLEKRQKAIAKGLEDAKAAESARAEITAQKDGILLSAREEGGKIVEGLRKEGTEAERKTLREAQEKSAAILAESRNKAEEERVHILRESEKEVAKMAVLAAEKVMHERRHALANK